DDGGEARVAACGQSLVEALAAHADLACEFAEIAGAGDCPERPGDEGWIVAALRDGSFEVGGNILGAFQVVGAVVPVGSGPGSPGQRRLSCRSTILQFTQPAVERRALGELDHV